MALALPSKTNLYLNCRLPSTQGVPHLAFFSIYLGFAWFINFGYTGLCLMVVSCFIIFSSAAEYSILIVVFQGTRTNVSFYSQYFLSFITFQLQNNVSSCIVLVWIHCQLPGCSECTQIKHATTLHAHSLVRAISTHLLYISHCIKIEYYYHTNFSNTATRDWVRRVSVRAA